MLQKITPTLYLSASLILGSLPLVGFAASSLPIEDTFEVSQNLNNDGWYFRHYSTAGAAWFQTSTSVSTVPAEATGGSMAATINTMLGTEAYRQFTPVTLSSVGDSISVSFDFRSTAVSAGGIQVAFLDLGTEITSNAIGGASPAAGMPGYAFRSEMNAATAAYYDNQDTSTPLSSGLASATIGDNLAHTLTYTISLTETGLSLNGQIDSTVVSSYEVNGVSSFTTDTLRINLPQLQNTQVFIDNVSVSAIPEPGHYGAIISAFVFLGLLLRRRAR